MKNEKKYDLIIELIKQHRKYPGLEDILEEIADDVYSRSESIIENIEDDSLLIGYLTKVVTTSIISVAKKLNRKTNVVRTSSAQEILANLKRQQEDLIQPSILETESITEVEVQEKEIEENDDELVTTTEDVDLTNEVEEIFNDNIDIEPDEFEDDSESTEPEMTHVNLVDNLINSIAQDRGEKEAVEDYAEAVEEQAFEELEMLEVFSQADTSEEIIESVTEDLELEVEDLPVDNVVESDDSQEEIDSQDLEVSDNLDDIYPEVANLDFNESIEDEILESINETELVEEDEPNIETAVIEERTVEKVHSELLNFDCFDFEPVIEVNDEFIERIKAFDEKHPENKLLQIWKSKYIERKTVEEIASEHELKTSEVISVLYSIIEIINLKE